MRIDRLHIEGLGALQDGETFSFPSECTVIRGGNETGKTTLTVALLGAFFGLPPEHPLPEEGDSRVAVDFRIGSRLFELQRDFRGGSVALVEDASDGRTVLFEGDPKIGDREQEFAQVLESLLGLSKGAAWTGAGLIQDGELGTRLSAAIQDWLAGHSRTEYERILAGWRTRRVTLGVEGEDEAPGELDELQAELTRVREEVSGWVASAGFQAATQALEAKNAELNAVEERVHSEEEMLQNLTRFEQLTRERNRLEDSLLEFRKERDQIRRHVEDEEKGEAKLEEEFANFLDAPSDIEERIQNWMDAVNRLRDLDESLSQTLSEIARLPVLHTRRNGLFASAILGFLAWLVCFGLGVPLLALFLFPAAIVLGYGSISIHDRNRSRTRTEHEQIRMVIQNERDEKRRGERAARGDLGLLARHRHPAKLRREHRRYQEARERLERSRSICASHRSLGTVMNSYEEVFSELQVLDTQTRDLVAQARYLSGLDMSPETLLQRIEEVRQVEESSRKQAEELRRELEELGATQAQWEEEIADPGRLMEDLEALEVRERELKQEQAALQVAEEVLQEAVCGYQTGYMDRVLDRASESLTHLTGGRYEAFRLTEQGDPEVRIDSRWLSIRALSRETRDQLYFVYRLALHQEVTGDRALPIVLDEAFLGWDDERLEKARDLVERAVEAGHQAIVLSADPRLAQWGRPVISLDERDGNSYPHSKAA